MVWDPVYLLVNKIFLVLIVLVTLWLTIWVCFSNFKNRVNQLFALTSLSFLFWWAGGYFFSFSDNPNLSLWFGRIILGIVSLSFTIFYFFISIFPYETKRNKILDKIVIFLAAVFALYPLLGDLVVRAVKATEWGISPIFGRGYLFYYGWIAFLMILLFIKLFQKYFQISGETRVKIQYVFIGFSIFILMNLTFNVLLPLFQGTIKYWQFGNYSAIALLGLTAYAIVKQGLFGIRVVLTALFVGLIAALLILDAFFVTQQPSWQILKASTLIVFLLFGYSLIRSVLREIKLREELQKAYEEVDRLSKTKSEFLSIASHQLRAPLTVIKGYISMLIEGTYGQLSEKQARPLTNVYQSNERLIKLVNDLLNLSRLEAGKIEFKPQLTSLSELILGIVNEMKINAEKKGLFVEIKKPSQVLLEIMADPDKLRQVILNIIDNAIKYTNQGGIIIKSEIRSTKSETDNKIIIEIKDTGEGMTQDEIKNLFQMFSRATAGSQFYAEGAGVGLYVAAKFIEMHQGRVWAESEGKGKGSTFYIELPIS